MIVSSTMDSQASNWSVYVSRFVVRSPRCVGGEQRGGDSTRSGGLRRTAPPLAAKSRQPPGRGDQPPDRQNFFPCLGIAASTRFIWHNMASSEDRLYGLFLVFPPA